MPQNFLACDREQELLLPPSLREWLPENHLAWCVIDAVGEFDLAAFYAAYRADGWGRAAHEPAIMVALLLYAYAVGERSSRRIERHCEHDVAFRVIAANRVPDHATIVRFRVRHEQALAELFGEVLALCAQAGLVRVGVIAVDGTKVHANASQHATRDYEQIAAEILAEADAVDRAETSASASGAATNCHRSSPPPKAGAGGCARPRADSTSGAPKRPARSPARVRSACRKPDGAWKKRTTSSARPTPPMRPTGRADG
jgi:transposase